MILQGEIEKQGHYYYEFDRNQGPVGRGGMGVVYRGRMVDESTGASRDVAIKEIQTEGSSDEQAVVIDRARREASIRLNNDNVVEMLGFVEVTDKRLGISKTRFYVISEFLDGVTLDKVLEGQCEDYSGHTVEYAAELYRQYTCDRENTSALIIRNVLSAIMALHDKGYVHRDIDPSNIMITADGRIKLFDLGIAKTVGSLSSSDSQNERGAFVGKVEYAAPELIQGRIQDQNATTDIYAIGVLFYKLLTGNLPFNGNRFEIQQGHLSKKPDLKKIKSERYRAVLAKSMAKPQQKRFISAASMRSALDGIDAASPSLHIVRIAVAGSIAVVALVAIILVLVKVINRNSDPDKNDFPIERNEEKAVENQDIEQRDTLSISSCLGYDIDSIWNELDANPNNPAVLYAIAMYVKSHSFRASDGSVDKRFDDFWEKQFISSGDNKRHLKGGETNKSSIRFRFLSLCKASDAIKSEEYTSKYIIVGAELVYEEINRMKDDKPNGGNNLIWP